MDKKQEFGSILWRGFLGLALLVGLSGNVAATTPDGETPANEGVCDMLQGGTPGLYGLCVAYCEAQDLDTLENKDPPNTKILDNYRKKMRTGDPDMPCLKTPCPCWTSAQLANIGVTGDTPVCSSSTSISQIRVLTAAANQLARADTSRNTCIFNDSTTVPPTALSFSISAEEAQICRGEIQAACAAIGQ